ncbi:MAG: hypothetical protein ACXVXT_05210 [Blastococcus sp.]
MMLFVAKGGVENLIHVEGKSFESLALPQPLRFRPPLVELARHPMAFNYQWQLMRYVFDLPSPYDFPPLRGWSAEDLRILGRFNTVAKRIAGGEVISGDYRVTVSVQREGKSESLEKVLPSDELMAGFAASFRQLYSDKEPASWKRVRDLMGRKSHEVHDEHRDQRLEWLARWRHAHGRLLATELSVLVGQKLAEEGKWGGPIPGEGASPTLLISQFQYGDLIHWDRHAPFIEQLAQDPTLEAMTIMDFLKSCSALCHTYFGVAVIIEAATRVEVDRRP